MSVKIDGSGIITGLDADGISAQPVFPGNVLQVVSTTKTDTFSASLNAGAISGDVTGLTASITPSSSANKILVMLNISGGADNNGVFIQVYVNGSLAPFVGDAEGNRRRASSIIPFTGNVFTATSLVTFLHSPSTTSTQTYSIRLSHTSTIARTVFVNRSATDSNNSETSRNASSITLMEIAG
jgi:hypothetical protein